MKIILEYEVIMVLIFCLILSVESYFFRSVLSNARYIKTQKSLHVFEGFSFSNRRKYTLFIFLSVFFISVYFLREK